MDQLIQLLKESLANTFVLYFKAHQFHWNVEGSNFPQYHEFLGNLYQELFNAVDNIAEQIRTLDVYTPTSLASLIQMSAINEVLSSGDITYSLMFSTLNSDNNVVLLTLVKTYQKAEELGQIGISNFLQDRITAHEKHGWMLRATNKNA
ncbi:DNA starvation/stationary phase protection protein [bacterium]|nr:DNA starvation/stationary phase protection protein [bacterium]